MSIARDQRLHQPISSKRTMTCRLMCKDGEVIEVDVETAKQSVLINGLIEDGGTDDEIPIAQVNKPIMQKVIVFCEHMREH